MSGHVHEVVRVSRPRRTTNRFAPQTHAQQYQRRRKRLRLQAWPCEAMAPESYLGAAPIAVGGSVNRRYLFSFWRKTTTSRTRSRICDSASAADCGSLLMNTASITCCPKWRRPSNTACRRSARVHSERFPNIPGELVLDNADAPEARSSDKQ